MATIEERAKDLCNDISNILIHHYKGHTTEFAEAKAVEDAITLINNVKQELIDKACKWLDDLMFAGGYDAYDRQENIKDFRKAMEE